MGHAHVVVGYFLRCYVFDGEFRNGGEGGRGIFIEVHVSVVCMLNLTHPPQLTSARHCAPFTQRIVWMQKLTIRL